MLLYNVTIKIDRDIEKEWLEWIKTVHIPEVVKAGKFAGSQISKLLDLPEDEDSTYVIQFRCESRAQYDSYIKNFSASLRDDHNRRYKDRFVAFRTLMEVI